MPLNLFIYEVSFSAALRAARGLICGPAGRSAFLFYFFIYFIFAASGGERE
jgi:hypothetical protein